MNKILTEVKILGFATAEVTDYLNPYLKYVKFIFADDKPNLNNQAIPYEEFSSLKASAIGMPIKMRFLGRRGGAGNHEGSIPIGHISGITEDTTEEGVHRLIAEGALYADEYPDIIEYLEEAYANNEAPGISWELSYHDSILEKGVMFLKGVVARAATFVKHPAYGKRTALLALASTAEASLDDPEVKQELLELLDEIRTILVDGTIPPDDEEEDMMEQMAENKGGTNNVTLEEAMARIAELEKENEAKASEIEALTTTANRVGELETANAELASQVAEYQKNALVEDRTRRAVEAGVVLETDAEKLAAKQELWIAMSEEIFAEFISTVSAVASKVPAKTAEASHKPALTLPKISVDTTGVQSTENLRDRMRSLSRLDDSAE